MIPIDAAFKDHKAIADLFKRSMTVLHISENQLARASGLSPRSLQAVLSGEHDYKLSTFLAVAEVVGLELALVPRAACASLQSHAFVPTEPVVLTRVQAALNEVKTRLVSP